MHLYGTVSGGGLTADAADMTVDLAVGIEPLPAGASLRCVPAASTAALGLEVALVYEDAGSAQVAAGSAPSLHLILETRDAPDG